MRTLLFAIAIISCLSVSMEAQAPLKPNDIQLLRLQVKLKDAQIAQMRLQVAQASFQQALSDLNNEAAKVKAENKWDDKVVFNADNLSFSLPNPVK